VSACAAVSGIAATTLSRRTVLQLQRATAVQGASGTLHGVLSEYMFSKLATSLSCCYGLAISSSTGTVQLISLITSPLGVATEDKGAGLLIVWL
jgi:hypothetical protein